MEPELILPLIIVGICVLFIIIVPLVAKKEQKDAIEQMDEEPQNVPEPDVIGAKVIKKRVGGECMGVKLPKYNAHFWLTFLTDNGEELEYEVSQELFDKIKEGDTASLVTINGNFLDFGDGEDIEETI